MAATDMKKIVELAKARWFVYQWSEIYWWLANTWDYGPYGSYLKENIKNAWIKEFVQKKDNMVLLDSAILMNPKTWVASGHVGWFSDPLIDCKSCKTRHRADKLIESKDTNPDNPEELEITSYLKEYLKKQNNLSEEKTTELFATKKVNDWTEEVMKNIKCPNCGKIDWTEIRNFNLMFKTFQWVTEASGTEVYLRPETAQGIFVNFSNVARTSRKKIPFWIAQVGKAFRNEITPGNFVFRTCEFEQMEIEFFCEPGTDLEWQAKWKEDCKNFLLNKIWIKDESLRYRDHSAEELSHYSNATTDIEFKFPFWWGELWGIADRTDFDLKAHMTESKQDLSYFDPVNNRKFIPYVIEPSVWLTRLFLATLSDAYDEVVDEETGESRIVMRFKPSMAPIKIWVLPVVKKLKEDAMKVYELLQDEFVCEYDETGSVGKRYARFDEIWTPYCVTIDSENFSNWQVTVRWRDTGEQELVKIDELVNYFRDRLK